jgi:hypothetical protein
VLFDQPFVVIPEFAADFWGKLAIHGLSANGHFWGRGKVPETTF